MHRRVLEVLNLRLPVLDELQQCSGFVDGIPTQRRLPRDPISVGIIAWQVSVIQKVDEIVEGVMVGVPVPYLAIGMGQVSLKLLDRVPLVCVDALHNLELLDDVLNFLEQSPLGVDVEILL